VVCFNGKAYYWNDHKDGNGLGALGSASEPLFDFAESVIRTLRERFPTEIIYEQVLRIDFWRDIRTNKYFLNEVEGKFFSFLNCVHQCIKSPAYLNSFC
jgi:hypothetical protein